MERQYTLVHSKKTEGPYGPFDNMSDLLLFAASKDLPADDWYVSIAADGEAEVIE